MAKRNKEEFFIEKEDGNRSASATTEEIHLKRYVEESPAQVEVNGPETKNGVITGALNVKMRRDPSSESEVLGLLRKGDRVTIHEKIGNFYKVSTKKYSMGYIFSDLIEEE